jgi:hypothetical protein
VVDAAGQGRAVGLGSAKGSCTVAGFHSGPGVTVNPPAPAGSDGGSASSVSCAAGGGPASGTSGAGTTGGALRWPEGVTPTAPQPPVTFLLHQIRTGRHFRNLTRNASRFRKLVAGRLSTVDPPSPNPYADTVDGETALRRRRPSSLSPFRGTEGGYQRAR